jgi:hypothetical protein
LDSTSFATIDEKYIKPFLASRGGGGSNKDHEFASSS